ncbi:MAG TPA: TonB-dependent receptor [Sphingomicrobium sp.]|nr:TonB-dependent receptor [Sphingomicrobium sp.]
MSAGWLSIMLAAAPAPAVVDEANEEVVVTGERSTRSIRKTASSVQVITESDIEAQGADRVEQVLAMVPNVQLGNGTQGPAIRGLDSSGPLYALPAFLGGNRPRTTIVVDGRAATYNEFVFGTAPVWDVARVEVFRSPQTTTQGQNSIAGAIFVNTNEPSFAPEYRARGIAGDLRERQASVVASGPIAGEGAAFRIAGDLRYSRTTSRIEDTMEGADPNHDVFGLLRAKLLLNRGPKTRLALTYVHSQSQAPQIVGVTAPFRDRRDVDGLYGIFRTNVDALTADVRHDIGPDLKANVLVTAGDSEAKRFAIPGLGQTQIDGRDWSAEAVLNWSPAGPFRLTGGVSHNHVALKQYIDLSLLSGSIGRFRDWQDGTGLFANVEYDLSPRATLTAGIRYQRDRQERAGALTANSFIIPVDFVGTFEAWLPKLSMTYDFSPNLRVGGLVQKSYNPGGTTIRVDTARPDNFKAESLWDYELFARGSLGAVDFDANLFYYDMANAQRAADIILVTPSGRRVGFANLFNVPRARSYGAEGQLRWRANRRVTGSIGIGLLVTRILDVDAESTGLEGKRFDRSPHFSGSAAVDWKPTGRLRLSAQLRHHSPYFADAKNSPELKIGSATNVDLRAQLRIGRISVFAQAKNLFDTFNLLSLSDADSGEAEGPRRLSIGLQSDF